MKYMKLRMEDIRMDWSTDLSVNVKEI